MTDTIRSRSPDEVGGARPVLCSGRLPALGHGRLSTIDLSATRHQAKTQPKTSDRLALRQ
jgi:hypothetical protein